MAASFSKDVKQRFIAAMVLSGAGDALGYKRGDWEFCFSGIIIHDDLYQIGGVKKIEVKLPEWIVSDDTVMHIATGNTLVENGYAEDKVELYRKMAIAYKKCMYLMKDRAPGRICTRSCEQLDPESPNGCQLPFDPKGGGCGGAMRAMCIGLRYCKPEQLGDLIEVGIESGRLTHHHPTGYLGSLATALFTSYAIQNKLPREWGAGLMSVLPQAKEYIRSTNLYVQENMTAWDYFENRWSKYLTLRKITDGTTDPVFPEHFGINQRDIFYKQLSYNGRGGGSGHDAPIIAYDGILGCNGDWVELCDRAMFHGGDNDSTGVIAAALYGAMFGFARVPKKNYMKLEFKKDLENIGEKLYDLQFPREQNKCEIS